MNIRKYLKADKSLRIKFKRLTDESARPDGFAADIDLDTSMNAAKNMPSIFTFEDGGSLTALLTVFAPGWDEIEINALVHPEFRNKGIFRGLLEEAVNTALKFGYRKGLFVCNRGSVSGQGVMRRWGCGIDHAELEMSCETSAESDCRGIEITEAQENDIEALSCLGAAAFEMDEEFEREIIKNTLASEDRIQYIAKYEGRMVGLCAAAESEEKINIFGLGVHPGERRKGCARALLNHIAVAAREKGIHELRLDVDEDNPGAIALYRSFGFKTTGCIEYYGFSLEAFK